MELIGLKFAWAFASSYLVLMFVNTSMINAKKPEPENLALFATIVAGVVSLGILF